MPVEVVAKEPAKAPSTTGFWWGLYIAGIASGFFVGVGASDWDGGDRMSAAVAGWEPVAAAVSGLAAGLGLLRLLRERGVSPVVPSLVLLAGASGAFLVVFGGRAVDDLRGSAQLRAWFGTAEARVGVVVLLAALVLTLVEGGHHDRHTEH